MTHTSTTILHTWRKALALTALMLLALSCPAGVWAQLTQVTGTVDDSTGEPLIGASVTVQGSKVATVTDIDGNFVLRVQDPNKAVLEISYIGYESQTIALNGRTNIKVTLKESTAALEEVVIVGYGQQKKE